MKIFQMMELREAEAWVLAGGQAVHLHTLTAGHPLFERYPEIAHLMDQDLKRLKATAFKLGVRVLKVEREGDKWQHIDLCGEPLVKARRECAAPELGLLF